MQIKIEIDVKPEELRRFLGLPDVAGLQEELIAFVRDKVAEANVNFDPATFVKVNLDTLRSSRAWQRLIYGTGEEDESAGDTPVRARGKRTPKASKRSSRRSG